MATYLSKSAFAQSQGWAPSYVTKLGKQGRLALAPDGKRVDVEATLLLIGHTADPSKDGVRDRHQQNRTQRDVYVPLSSEPDSSGPSDFHKHKTDREKYMAGIAKIEYDKARGNTVERQPVVDAAFRGGRLIRDTVLGVPKQISAELAAISDPWELERKLTESLRTALEEVVGAVNDDLDYAME